MPTQKLYCYVDETGALPAGKSARSNTLHLILDISQDCRPTPDLLPSQANSTPLLRGAVLSQRLERLEQISGKGHVKWHRTKHLARLAYIRAVLTLPLPTRALLCYEV